MINLCDTCIYNPISCGMNHVKVSGLKIGGGQVKGTVYECQDYKTKEGE